MAKKQQKQEILMPRATAVWLIDHTALTFQQIADFTNLHLLEIQALADGDGLNQSHMQGFDPILAGQLTRAEIDRCEKNPEAKLNLNQVETYEYLAIKKRGPRYTPIAKRGDKPDAIVWLIKNYPDMSDSQISKLIGTTINTIRAVRSRTHWNMPNLKPGNPLELGLCTSSELEKMVAKIKKPKNSDNENEELAKL